MINGCERTVVSTEDLSYKDIINKQFSNPPLSMQVEKILWEKIISDSEVISFFLNKEHTISVSRIAKIKNNWQARVSAPTDRRADEIISWQMSLLSNSPNEDKAEVAAIIWGYIYSPEVTKVLVGTDKQKGTFKEAEILEFNEYNIKIYYFLTDDETGFNNDTIVAYNNAGTELFSNRNNKVK